MIFPIRPGYTTAPLNSSRKTCCNGSNFKDSLHFKVTAALYKQMDRKKRPGWVREDSFHIEASHAEILNLNK